jgi:hypothetical protein
MAQYLWENDLTGCHWQESLVLEDAWMRMGLRSAVFVILAFVVYELVPT